MYSAADIVTTPALSVDLCNSLSWLCNIFSFFFSSSCKRPKLHPRGEKEEEEEEEEGKTDRGYCNIHQNLFFFLLHGARAKQTGPSWVWYCHGEIGYSSSSRSGGSILLHPRKKHRRLRRRPHRLPVLLLPALCRVMVGLPCWMLPALSGSSTTEPPLTADPHFRRKPSQSYRATYGNWGSKF